MERQITKRYVPKRISTGFDSEADIRKAANLIKAVAGSAIVMTEEARQQVETENEKKNLQLKLSAAKMEADQQGEMIEAQGDLEERAARIRQDIAATRNAQDRVDHYNRKEQQRQRLGWKSEIADKSVEELRGATARSLGYTDPIAAEAVDEAIGQAIAMEDFPALLSQIATDPTKTASEHLEQWVEKNALADELPNASYEAELRRMVDPYRRREVLDEAERAQRARFNAAINDISTNVRLLLPDMTRQEFETLMMRNFADLQKLQPKLTLDQYYATVAEVLEDSLTGPNAEYPPQAIISKIESWYSREEQADQGLLPFMARLRNSVSQGRALGAADQAKYWRQVVSSSRSHATLRQAETAINELNKLYHETGRGVSDEERMALLADINEKYDRPDVAEEVMRRLAGQPVPMTEEHDAQIDKISREQSRIAWIESAAGPEAQRTQEDLIAATQAWDRGEFGRLTDWDGDAWRAGFQVQEFGRLTANMKDQLISALSSADMPHLPAEQRFQLFRQGVAMLQSIENVSPNYAMTLAEEEGIGVKAMVTLAEAKASGLNLSNLIQAYGPIPDHLFERAESMLGEISESDSSALRRRQERWNIAGADQGFESTPEVQQYWRNVYRGHVASAIHYQGESGMTPEEILKAAERHADKMTKKAFDRISINGERYAITRKELNSYGWGDAEKGNITRLWRQHRQTLRDDTQYSSFEPVWSARRVERGEDDLSYLVVPVMSAELGYAQSVGFLPEWRIPLSASMIKIKARGPAKSQPSTSPPLSPAAQLEELGLGLGYLTIDDEGNVLDDQGDAN